VTSEAETSEPIDLSFRWDGSTDAPTLVLSHGLGLSMAMWEPQVARLAASFRVLRYDHRGHGSSPVPPGPYAIADFGRDLLRLLDRLELERVAFCGLSLGGMVGMWLSANASDRIDRLIACCTAARMPHPEDYAARAHRVRRNGILPIADVVVRRWFTPSFFSSRSETVGRIQSILLSTDREGYAATCDALASMDLRDELQRIVAPTLVVAGSQDQATPVAQAQEIAGRIGGARLVVLEGAPHLANVEQPDRLSALIVDEMRSADAGQRP